MQIYSEKTIYAYGKSTITPVPEKKKKKSSFDD
jgi:hypothetical protein